MRCTRTILGITVITAMGMSTIASTQSETTVVEPDTKQYAASPSPHVRLFGVVLKESVWLQKDRVVFVCWESGSPGGSHPANVRRAIEDTWQKESALSFRGWEPCAAASRGIRIRVEDAGPHTKGLGRMLDGRPAGMVLNFSFRNWSASCQARLDFCIKAIAVHEFGHAIGFAHEQNRADAPGECQALRQGTNGDLLLTPYDPRSVMNYCNERYNNEGRLSELDIAAVRDVYGPPSSSGGQ